MMNEAFCRTGFFPVRIADPVAWVGHLPFAYWLTGVIRPQVFFELGTHSGNSYFTFCQAVREHGLSTRCHAVDLWTGDRHSGSYNSSIHGEVTRHNETQYAAWSSLWRMSFDEAVTRVPDRSIDLLHIDGLHTYQAVRHDFETWQPKLAEDAWVLFHDTHVREGDFGVWRFWDEMKARYPRHLEFSHSHGLGVLTTGKNKSEAWMTPGSPEQTSLIVEFQLQGERLLAWRRLYEKRHRKMLGRWWQCMFPGHPKGLGVFRAAGLGSR
jgi:hypothetical protein